MNLSTRAYDILKWITLIVLPALATLYLALAETWNLPYPTEVAGTIAAIDVFLATLMGISVGYFRARMSTALSRESTQMVAMENGAWIFDQNLYKSLTWVAQVLLPGLTALYWALSALWPLPAPNEVVSTLTALDTFLGLILGFSSAQYMKSIALTCVEPGTNVYK